VSDTKRTCVCAGAGPELSRLLANLGPGAAAMEHFKGARIEFLKGVRAMIDKQIDSLSKPEGKGEKVTVE